jgi:hypothetical protein
MGNLRGDLSELFRVGKIQGTAVLGAVPAGQVRPWMRKGNALFAFSKTLSFGTITCRCCTRRSTSCADQLLYERVHLNLSSGLARQ